MSAFEKTQMEKDIELLFLTAPAPGVHCARNAFRSIERAFAIAEVDSEMAAFRAITAEEEAASAVFHAIRRRNYIGSKKLNPRDHLQKNALYPFIEAMRRLFAELEAELEPNLQGFFDLSAKQLYLTFDPRKSFNPAETVARFVPPLHFSVSVEDGKLYDFSRQIKSLAADKGVDSIQKYLKRRANQRNRLLYASEKGIPGIADLERFLVGQRERVNRHLLAFLLIDPHPEKQNFVQQGLFAFLKMLDRLPEGIVFE
jgi:hypothetical protein